MAFETRTQQEFVAPATGYDRSVSNSIFTEALETAGEAGVMVAKNMATRDLAKEVEAIDFARSSANEAIREGLLASQRLATIKAGLKDEKIPQEVQTEMDDLVNRINRADDAVRQGVWRPDWRDAQVEKAVISAQRRRPAWATEFARIGNVGGAAGSFRSEGEKAMVKQLDAEWGVNGWGLNEQLRFHYGTNRKFENELATNRIGLSEKDADAAVQKYNDVNTQSVHLRADSAFIKLQRAVNMQGGTTPIDIDQFVADLGQLEIQMKKEASDAFSKYQFEGKKPEHLQQMHQHITQTLDVYRNIAKNFPDARERLKELAEARNLIMVNNAPPIFHALAVAAGAIDSESKALLLARMVTSPASVLQEMQKLGPEYQHLGLDGDAVTKQLAEYFNLITNQRIIPPGYERTAVFFDLQVLRASKNKQAASNNLADTVAKLEITPASYYDQLRILAMPDVNPTGDHKAKLGQVVTSLTPLAVEDLVDELDTIGMTLAIDGNTINIVPKNNIQGNDTNRDPLTISGVGTTAAARTATERLQHLQTAHRKFGDTTGLIKYVTENVIVPNQPKPKKPVSFVKDEGLPWDMVDANVKLDLQGLNVWEKIDYLASQEIDINSIPIEEVFENVGPKDVESIKNNIQLKRRNYR